MATRARTLEPLHPAVFGTVLLLLVSVGRLPELVPALGVLALGNVGAALGILGLLVGRWRDDVPVLQTSTGRLMALFVLLAGLSVGYSIWNSGSLAVFLTSVVTNGVMFYLLARTANSPRMLRIYAGTAVACAAMLSIDAVVGYTAGRVKVTEAYDANDLAMVLVTILPFVVAGILARGGLRRWMLAGVAVVMLLTILLTGSRGGMLGLVAVVGYLMFARFPRPKAGDQSRGQSRGRSRGPSRRLTFGKVLVIVAGGVLLVTAMPQLTWHRMATLTDLEDDYNFTAETGRIAIWGRGIEAIAERPWGYGVGTFETVEMRRGGHYKAAHNIWIEVGVELGLQGALLLFGMFWTVARTATRTSARAFDTIDRDEHPSRQTRQLATLSVALKGSLLGYFVTSLFLSVVFTGVFYALLALAAALERQEWALARGEGWQGAGGERSGRRTARSVVQSAGAFADGRGGVRGSSWTR